MSTLLFIRRGRLAEIAQTAFIEKFGLRRKFEALTCAILLHLPFVQIQTKESRLKRKIASFRPDLDERQLPFVQAQTKDNFLSSRLRRKTASFCQDLDVRQLPFVQT